MHGDIAESGAIRSCQGDALLTGIREGEITCRGQVPGQKPKTRLADLQFGSSHRAGRRDQQQARPANAWRGRFWGVLSGFTSFGIHAGGPPINVYMLPQRLEKTLLMGTLAVFFTLVNWVKVPAYLYLGQFSSENLLTSLVLMPLAPIGVRCGYWLLQRSNEKLIYQLCYVFLLLTGGKLLVEGVMGLLA